MLILFSFPDSLNEETKLFLRCFFLSATLAMLTACISFEHHLDFAPNDQITYETKTTYQKEAEAELRHFFTDSYPCNNRRETGASFSCLDKFITSFEEGTFNNGHFTPAGAFLDEASKRDGFPVSIVKLDENKLLVTIDLLHFINGPAMEFENVKAKFKELLEADKKNLSDQQKALQKILQEFVADGYFSWRISGHEIIDTNGTLLSPQSAEFKVAIHNIFYGPSSSELFKTTLRYK